MYSQAEAHLTILDNCPARSLRCAYLALLIAAERAGLRCVPREAARSLLIRDDYGRQYFTITLSGSILLFTFCLPVLERRPELAAQAHDRFIGLVRGMPGSKEVAICVGNEHHADDIVDWLFPDGKVILGYEARRSA